MYRHLGRFVAISVFAVSLGTLGTSALAQAEQDFRLVNGTEYDIDEVYVAPKSSKSWGKDIMGDGVLEAGKAKEVKFRSGSKNCLYNMRVLWSDGTATEWAVDFDLCKISKITLLYNKASDVTTAITE